MFEKIFAFFEWLVTVIFLLPNQESNIVVTKEIDLMTQIDAKRFAEVEKILAILTVNVHRLVEEEKKTQEYIVHLSTLHEELLNQLDQGNIAMVRVRRDGVSTEDEDIEAMMRNETQEPTKKTDLN